MLVKITKILLLVQAVFAQNPSPCPQIFSYEPRGQEQDRWYGVIALQSKDDLDGVWLKIVLDRPAELLGNWFGEAVSTDNEEFTIKNSRYKLEAGPPVSVRFFVKYNAASTIPSVMSIKLNGKTICTTRRDEVASTTPQLHISKPVTNRPHSRPGNSRPGGSSNESPYLTGSSQETTGFGSSNNVGAASVEERPLSNTNFGTSQRPSRPSTNQFNNNNNNERERPTSSNQYNNNNSNERDRPTNNNNQQSSSNNNDYQTGTSNRRPPGSSHSSSSTTNQRDREAQNSGTTPNVLSAEEESTNNNGFDFFPGDFALHRPSQTRPPSRPSSINKRNVQCGTVAMKASPLISFGQNTTQGQWPWHAALYYAQGAQLMYTCGATLISENHILTAAHCVAKPQTNRPIDTKKLAVYLGKYSLKKFGSGTQDREVSDIFIHPQYNYSVYFNDIAVLKLKNPIDITNYVRPCCLWEDGSTDIERVLNKLGTVVGWGFDENRQISDSLMQAQMPVVSTVNCIYSNREFFSQFTFEKTYCAGFRNGTTVCNGDSGGGMVFPKSGTSGHNTVWQIRGIVSVGVALQGQGVCDPSHYIVFTDVAKHLDWIKRVMNE